MTVELKQQPGLRLKYRVTEQSLFFAASFWAMSHSCYWRGGSPTIPLCEWKTIEAEKEFFGKRRSWPFILWVFALWDFRCASSAKSFFLFVWNHLAISTLRNLFSRGNSSFSFLGLNILIAIITFFKNLARNINNWGWWSDSSKKLNDWISQIFLSWPYLKSVLLVALLRTHEWVVVVYQTCATQQP